MRASLHRVINLIRATSISMFGMLDNRNCFGHRMTMHTNAREPNSGVGKMDNLLVAVLGDCRRYGDGWPNRCHGPSRFRNTRPVIADAPANGKVVRSRTKRQPGPNPRQGPNAGHGVRRVLRWMLSRTVTQCRIGAARNQLLHRRTYDQP